MARLADGGRRHHRPDRQCASTRTEKPGRAASSSARGIRARSSMALPPCHACSSSLCKRRTVLPALPTQRRPFSRRAVQYRLLRAAHTVVAQVCGLKPGDLSTRSGTCIFTAIISNRRVCSSRANRVRCRDAANPAVKNLFAFRYEDFTLEGYDPHPPSRPRSLCDISLSPRTRPMTVAIRPRAPARPGSCSPPPSCASSPNTSTCSIGDASRGDDRRRPVFRSAASGSPATSPNGTGSPGGLRPVVPANFSTFRGRHGIYLETATSSCVRPIAGAASVGRCSIIWRALASSAGGRGSSGRCSTGTRRRSRSTDRSARSCSTRSGPCAASAATRWRASAAAGAGLSWTSSWSRPWPRTASSGAPWFAVAFQVGHEAFRAITMGHPVVVGRKTYLSISASHWGTHHIMVSRDRAFAAPGVVVAPTLVPGSRSRAATRCGARHAIMVVGGGEIYPQAMRWRPARHHRVHSASTATRVSRDRPGNLAGNRPEEHTGRPLRTRPPLRLSLTTRSNWRGKPHRTRLNCAL